MTQRIALGVEYDGSAFHGWQRQSAPHMPTVQEAVERALSQVAAAPVKLVCAGRTDTGVHASAQVAHFDTAVDRGEKAWVRGGNSMLPPAARILWARPMDERFHARFSALSRRYRYVIYDGAVAPAIMARQLTHTRLQLDIEAMHEAGQYLIGEHDFSAFRAAGCQSRSPFRNLMELRVSRQQRYIVIDIEANAFLQHMVRNITGALLEVGAGRQKPQWLAELLSGRDRRLSAVTASPYGLYLVQVAYPAEFAVPSSGPGPAFLPLHAQTL